MKSRNNITELVFILDRSGSMSGLESDTIGGFNALIEKRRRQDGECYVSTVFFDNVSEVLYDCVRLSKVPKMTDLRMEERGVISSYSKVVKGKRFRRYYHIEKDGIDYLERGSRCGAAVCTKFLNNMKIKI